MFDLTSEMSQPTATKPAVVREDPIWVEVAGERATFGSVEVSGSDAALVRVCGPTAERVCVALPAGTAEALKGFDAATIAEVDAEGREVGKPYRACILRL